MKFNFEGKLPAKGTPAKWRKARHWSGYGSLWIKMDGVGSNDPSYHSAFIDILIKGEHERGEIPRETIDLLNWICGRLHISCYRVDMINTVESSWTDERISGDIIRQRIAFRPGIHLYQTDDGKVLVTPEDDISWYDDFESFKKIA